MARDRDKPGIDWVALRAEVQQARYSLREIARRYGVTHQAIQARRDREGWDARPQHVDRSQLPMALGGALSEEVVDGVLWAFEEGGSEEAIALAVGLEPAQFHAKIEADPSIKLRVMAAIGKNLLEMERRLTAAGRRGVWQIDHMRLKSNTYTRSTYQEKASDTPRIAIQMNFDRASDGPSSVRVLGNTASDPGDMPEHDPFT